MLPLSPEPMRSSTGNSIESVEQPWWAAEAAQHGWPLYSEAGTGASSRAGTYSASPDRKYSAWRVR